MWFLAHVGYASAVFAIGCKVARKKPNGERRAAFLRWFLLGSILPDLVDKPVGRVIFGDQFQNGRIFFHTFLFLIVLVAVGFFLWRRGEPRLGFLAAGMALHLLLDGFWSFPETFLWPSLGPFPRYPETGSFWKYLVEQFRNPWFIITELSGALALLISLRAMGYISPLSAKRLFLRPFPGGGR